MIEKIVSDNFIKIGLVTATGGFTKGFCDSVGAYFPAYLILSLPILHGIFGVFDGISIAKKGEQITGNFPIFAQEEVKKIMGDIENQGNKKLYGSYMGFMGESLMAGVEIGIGYLLGRFIGYKIKNS